MKQNLKSLVLFSSSIFILLNYCLVNAVNLIPETCKKLSQDEPRVYYDFCEAALGTAPGGTEATSVAQLGCISFQLDVSELDPILSKITTLLGESEIDQATMDALEACSDLYSGARDDLVAGLEFFEAGNYSMANTRASVVLNAPITCEGGFKKEHDGVVSVLTTENDDFSQFVAISIGFTNLLDKFE